MVTMQLLTRTLKSKLIPQEVWGKQKESISIFVTVSYFNFVEI